MPFWGGGGREKEEAIPRHLPLPTGPYAVGYQVPDFFFIVPSSVTYSYPYWIRIKSGQWIRIRIQEGKNDPQK
jgi:hypothetical protein